MFFRRPVKPARVPALLLLCALAALLSASALSAGRAQSGRILPPTAPQQMPTPSPVPSPAPEATPAPAPTPDEDEDGEDVERIDTDLANVLLTATDKQRRFVTTIGQGDIRLLEDGVPQQLLAFQRETDLPLSLAVLIDLSASQEGVLKDEQEAARTFIASVLRPGKDSASVVSFTGVTRIEQPLTDDRDALNSAVERVKVLYNLKSPECNDEDVAEELRIRCLTAVWDSIIVTNREILSHTPERTRRAIILLSDGDDTHSVPRVPYRAVEDAIKNNTVVYAIGIRDNSIDVGELKKDYLRNVSEETGGRAFFPKNKAELDAAFAQIGQELRSQYLLSYAPSNKTPDGRFRRVEVEIINPTLRKQKLRLFYRQGYFARGATTPTQATRNQ